LVKRTGYRFEEVDRIIYRKKKAKLLGNEVLFKVINDIFYGNLRKVDEAAFL